MEGFIYTQPVSTPIFNYFPPLSPVKGFISIPHSGLDVPDEFRQFMNPNLTVNQLNEDVDYAVDQLVNITELQEAGIAVMVAKIHRVCVDLNRAPDIAVFSWKSNTKGIEMITTDPSEDVKQAFIIAYHTPYFEFMSQVVKNIQQIKLGFVSLLDLHSMPSKPTLYHLTKNPNQSTDRRSDFCLSDLKGLSCQRSYINGFFEQLQNLGYKPSINDPYFGGYITQFMDTEFSGNNIQCEINRDIYMDEVSKQLLPKRIEILLPQLTKIIIDMFIAYNTPFKVHQQSELSDNQQASINSQFAFEFQ